MSTIAHREVAAAAVVLVLVSWSWAGPAVAGAAEEKTATAESTKSAFEAAATRIDTLDPSEWMYDRFAPIRPGRYELSKLPSLEKWPFPAIAERRSILENCSNRTTPSRRWCPY